MKHTLRLHTATETTDQPLPEVALPRLRSALNNIEFNVNVEAHIVPRRDKIGQPRHERIIAEFDIEQSEAKSVVVSELANEILYDIPWHVIYHKQNDSWTQVARYGDVPDTL